MLPEASSLWLLRLLRDIQLAQFYRPILEELNVTRPEHFDFVKPEDLDGIGMGRPGKGPLRRGPALLVPIPGEPSAFWLLGPAARLFRVPSVLWPPP
uniref:non-specific protein-tyrosine kinase n=1 Tax=Panthera tigris altaica TaxID=74533 RepID=A0A8C9KF37_PANTA